jgi:integrase
LSASLEQEAKPWQDYFALTLHYGTRKNELLSARWENIDFTAGRLVVPKTKAGKALVLPLDEQARSIIEGLGSRGRSEWLFPALGWSKHEYIRDAQGVWERIRERAGVTDRDAVIHTLRHTALTELAAAGHNASVIQSLANHASLSMSQKYIDRLKLNVSGALEDPSRPSFVKRTLPTPVSAEAANTEPPLSGEMRASGDSDVDDPLC